jgi:hypothetical protein
MTQKEERARKKQEKRDELNRRRLALIEAMENSDEPKEARVWYARKGDVHECRVYALRPVCANRTDALSHGNDQGLQALTRKPAGDDPEAGYYEGWTHEGWLYPTLEEALQAIKKEDTE